MSTKIYEGLKLKKNMTFFEVNELMRKIRKRCEIIQNEVYQKASMKELAFFVDMSLILSKEEMEKRYGLKKGDPFRPYLHYLKLMKLDEIIAQPVYCEVMLFPVKEEILALTFGHIAFRGLFHNSYEDDKVVKEREFEEFEEFGYWNNTDMPDDLSKEEWERRRNLWNEALHGIGIPAQNGISKLLCGEKETVKKIAEKNPIKAMECYEWIKNGMMGVDNGYSVAVTEPIYYPGKESLKFIPSDEIRINRVLENYCEGLYEKEVVLDNMKISEFIRGYMKFKKRPDIVVELDKKRLEIKENLPDIKKEWRMKVYLEDLYKN